MSRRQHLNFVAFVSKPKLEGTSCEAEWRWQTEDKIGPEFLKQMFGNWESEVKELISVSHGILRKVDRLIGCS